MLAFRWRRSAILVVQTQRRVAATPGVSGGKTRSRPMRLRYAYSTGLASRMISNGNVSMIMHATIITAQLKIANGRLGETVPGKLFIEATESRASTGCALCASPGGGDLFLAFSAVGFILDRFPWGAISSLWDIYTYKQYEH